MEEYSVIGKRLPRVDGIPMVTGEAQYVGDMAIPGMLHGKILRSPHPHAKILKIDTGKAQGLQGVKGIVTGRDTLGVKFGFLPVAPETMDEPLLAMGKVRYIGEPVAAVAAIDEDTAMEALDFIEVEYEPLPAVFDPLEAMKPDASMIHDKERNICTKFLWNFGDVEKGFEQSYHVREDRFGSQAIQHCALEPHAAIASFDHLGNLTLWSSTQTPYRVSYGLSKTLGMHEDKIRVIVPYLGGGFGSKAELLALDFCVSLLSKKLGKPVRIAYTREEVFTATRRRHPMMVNLKTGVKRDGSLVAQEARIISDTGAYNSTGTVALYIAGILLNLPYKIPNLKFEGYSVFTNNPVSGAMRGHGAPQSRFAADCQLDMIAADLGMDPLEVRLKNGIQAGEMTSNKMVITSCGLAECIHKAADDSKWKQKRGKMSRNRGMGMGCHAFISGPSFPINPSNYAFTSASVEVHEKGRVSLLLGAIDMGQGSNTVLAQIAAEELGVPLENVRVVSGDQGVTPVDMGSFGSRVTFMTGNAVKAAAAEAKKQLFETAADMMEANVEDLQAKDQRIYIRGSSEKGMPLGEVVVARQLVTGGRPVLGKGYYNPKIEPINIDTGEGNLAPSWSFAAHIAEVEVDETSGEVKLYKLTVAHDCGRAINPMALEGQLEGSAVMGQGQALYEDLLCEEGRTLNPSFLSYGLPLSLNIPEIRSIVVETVDPEGPFGAKEGGEGNLISTLAAIANAVYDAIGVRINDLPITPEKILKALEERQR